MPGAARVCELPGRALTFFIPHWAGGPLIWRSKKHLHIALSSSEAEYMTLTHAWKHVKWLRSLLQEMGLSYMVDSPTQMIGDNRNATDWAVEKMITDGNRHIDISYMKIREPRVRQLHEFFTDHDRDSKSRMTDYEFSTGCEICG